MKLYFDTCSLQRPLDDKTQLRIALEAEAILGILTLCEAGSQSLVSSEILVIENERNSQPQRRAFVAALLDQAANFVVINERITRRARVLEKRGFKAFDALHIACAESDKVDYLCTCDDRLLRNARRQSDLAVKIVSPLELANEVSV